MFKRYYENHKAFVDKFDGLLLKNTVLDKGLVIAPIVVLATTFINSLILGLAFVMITFATVLLSSFVPKKLPYTIRVIIYVVLASIIYIPVAHFLDGLFPESIFKLGIFLPLLVTNSLIVTRTETKFFREPRTKMIVDLFSHVIGFFVVIILVGIIRELMGQGTFMGNEVEWVNEMLVFALPFGGFVVLGFLAAFMQRFSNHIYGKDVKSSVNEKREVK